MKPRYLNKTFHDSYNDMTYKPNSKELTSTYSEYPSNISECKKETRHAFVEHGCPRRQQI